jgi:hypothetical protein
MDNGIAEGLFGNARERERDGPQKLAAKSFTPRFIPAVCLAEVDLRLGLDDKRRRHGLPVMRRRTCSQGEPTAPASSASSR